MLSNTKAFIVTLPYLHFRNDGEDDLGDFSPEIYSNSFFFTVNVSFSKLKIFHYTLLTYQICIMFLEIGIVYYVLEVAYYKILNV